MSKQEAIESQAIRLFSERGVDAVSVRDIATACGMSPSNLYAHYSGKEELVASIFRSGFAEYAAHIRKAVGDSTDFGTALEKMVEVILRLHDKDTERFRFLVLRQHSHLGGIAKDENNPVEVIRAIVAGAMKRGEIPARDPDLMALCVVGLVVQPATGHLYGRLKGRLARHAGEISAACLRALS